MEQITFEIPSPPEMSVEERNKLVRQAADRGFIIFFKQFIPLFFIRYWQTRYYQGPNIWFFLLSAFSFYLLQMSAESKLECERGGKCDINIPLMADVMGPVIGVSSCVMFGISAGLSSKRARIRLGIDQETALAILPAIKVKSS